jgi:hypothetical protein
MSLESWQRDELYEICSAICDNAADGEMYDRLQAILKSGPEARQLYLRYLNSHVQLQQLPPRVDAPNGAVAATDGPVANGPAVADPPAAPPGAPVPRPLESPLEPPKTTLFSLFLPSERWLDAMPVVMFALLMLSVGVFFGWRVGLRQNAEQGAAPVTQAPATIERGAGNVAQREQPAQQPQVATLVEDRDCQWIEAPADFHPGSTIAEGDALRLASGVAEIMFRSGARLTLEGPAVMTGMAAGGGALESGSLAAHVPPQAVGFAVRTPAATIIDLGTSFGVTVDQARVTEVHVIEGRVAIETAASERRQIVAAPEARRLPSADPSRWMVIDAVPERFYRTAMSRFAPTPRAASPRTKQLAEPRPAAKLPAIDGQDSWNVLASDSFDAAQLDGRRWEVHPGPPDVALRHKPGVAPKDGMLELTNCGILMSRESYAASAERPVRVTAEWQAGNKSDGPTIALDVAPAENPTPNHWVTHSIQCTYNVKNPHTNESSLVIMFGYPGQEQMEVSFIPCEAAEPGGHYRLDVVRYTERVVFQVRCLDGEGWTRTATAKIPAAFSPGTERRVALLNFVLAPQSDVVCHVDGVSISTLGQ